MHRQIQRKPEHPPRAVRAKRALKNAPSAAGRLVGRDSAAELHLQSLLHELDKIDEYEDAEDPSEPVEDSGSARDWSHDPSDDH